MREINSAWGRNLLTHSQMWTLAGESCILLGKVTPLSLDTSYPVGSVCITSHVLQLALSLYLVDRATARFGHFLFAPVPGITSNCLLFFHVNICEHQLFSNVYIENESMDVLAK